MRTSAREYQTSSTLSNRSSISNAVLTVRRSDQPPHRVGCIVLKFGAQQRQRIVVSEVVRSGRMPRPGAVRLLARRNVRTGFAQPLGLANSATTPYPRCDRQAPTLWHRRDSATSAILTQVHASELSPPVKRQRKLSPLANLGRPAFGCTAFELIGIAGLVHRNQDLIDLSRIGHP